MYQAKFDQRKIVHAFVCLFVLVFVLFNPSSTLCQDTIWVWTYPSAADLSAEVMSAVNIGAGNYTYSYTVENSSLSVQSLESLFIEFKSAVNGLHTPSNWFVLMSRTRQAIMWFSEDSLSNILPSNNLAGYNVNSQGLPTIFPFYIRGHAFIPIFEEGAPDNTIGGDVFENSFKGRTLGPRTPPTPFVALDFLDTLISMAEEALSLGWIEETYSEKIMNDLNDAREKIEESPEDAKEILEALIPYIIDDGCDWAPPDPSQYHLTSEGCALLRYNLEYLIEQIE